MLTVDRAEQILRKGYEMNPGNWYYHSKNVATAARNIAIGIGDIDADKAYIYGLLHDIGRREGNYNMRHTIDGYKYLMEFNYYKSARICITHLFPSKDMYSAIGLWDCSEEDRKFIMNYINEVEYDIYDRLIQLCDYLALHNGFTILEKRFVDVAMRYNVDQYTTKRWAVLYDLKKYFDSLVRMNIYKMLPEIQESLFELL